MPGIGDLMRAAKVAEKLRESVAPAFARSIAKHSDLVAQDIASQRLRAGGVSNITDADVRHEIARHNAALPKDLGGLGLPEKNTAEQRAKALGFGDEVYHGSLRSNVQRFNPTTHGTDESFAGRGVYTTTSPEDASKNYASAYGPDPKSKIISALEQRERPAQGTIGRLHQDDEITPARLETAIRESGVGDTLGVVYPLHLREGLKLNMNAARGAREGIPLEEELFHYPHGDEGDIELTRTGDAVSRALGQLPTDKANEVLWNVHEDGPQTINDLRRSISKHVDKAEVYNDEGMPISGASIASDAVQGLGVDTLRHYPEFGNPQLNMAESHFITFDPSRIRSRFAAFDPARKGSADTLAGVGGGALGAGLLAKYLRDQPEQGD